MARGRFAEAKGEYEEALRLAYEVGAYAETPFLIARLAEIAYRAGDRAGRADRAGRGERGGRPVRRAGLPGVRPADAGPDRAGREGHRPRA